MRDRSPTPGKMRGHLKRIAASALVALSLLAPSTALARTNSDAYSSTGVKAQQQVGEHLPFSGVDLKLVAGAGGVLLGMGAVIRRLSRPEAR